MKSVVTPGNLGDEFVLNSTTSKIHVALSEFFDLSGQWLADPDEMNGWGATGPFDPTNTQDLGNSNAVNLHYLTGGYSRPFEIELLRMYIWHRDNNTTVEPWGWYLSHGIKVENSTAVQVTEDVLHEVNDNGGVGPRDYPNTRGYLTDLDLTTIPSSKRTVPAYSVVNLSVSTPTAIATNRYVQVMTGWIEYKRVY